MICAPVLLISSTNIPFTVPKVPTGIKTGVSILPRDVLILPILAFLNFEINFKGTIDRVDTFDNKLRILDYKTGVVEQSKITIHEWESLTKNETYSQVFQLLLYVALWNHNNPKNKANNAGIIGLKLKENPIYFGEKSTKFSRNIDFDISEQTIVKFHQTLEIIMKDFFDATIPYESKKE